MAKVNANQLRKGNVVEINGKLLAVIAAQNIQPGKGTPVMQLELRDLSSGLKTRSEEHTSELQSQMRISYAVFCLKKKKLIRTRKTSHTYNPKYTTLTFIKARELTK